INVDPSGLLDWSTANLAAPPPAMTWVFYLLQPGKARFSGNCGAFAWTIDWKPGDKETNGFIAQRVEITDASDPCKGATLPCARPPKPAVCVNTVNCDDNTPTKIAYWELWRVKEVVA